LVKVAEPLAQLYSPDLLVTEQNLLDAQRAGSRDDVESARTRLRLLGIDAPQIDKILADGKPTTELTIRSPVRGHVIKKYVIEGQYVQEGLPLYDLADLSTIWIQAQLYEDDLAYLPFEHGTEATGTELEGVAASATIRSLPNQTFQVRRAFVFPHVDQATRTVIVRFELDNPDYQLRPGATATVTIRVASHQIPLLAAAAHAEHAGHTPEHGGRADVMSPPLLAVPEGAVIDTGRQAVVYRESSPGVFDGVEVVVGPRMSGPEGVTFFPVLKGLQRGDAVATSGSFLIDAETRLNPAAGSIYFGSGGSGSSPSGVTTAQPSTPADPESAIREALGQLSPEDRALAAAQKYCVVLRNNRLGSMGPPVKVVVEGQPVFLCCEGCKAKALADPQATLAALEELRQAAAPAPAPQPPAAPEVDAEEERRIAAELAKLSPEDRKRAEKQRFCVVETKNRLGSMGPPVKLMIKGQPVFLCCEGCRQEALDKPQEMLTRVKKLTGGAP
jgi:membrane fusion protein, copper/silver efflux system